eukprot:CAMPEP_0119313068 /NCGR_PEP_ID=MMETSP1333-20130426/27774_1 /TAXON_ID=418940 /ORGANISM="Scyphosphaera apsteinii, Strain RCC1455" /LENGTH=169 /DNA_ID=CAMNT_0007317801 /DNA_START=144 /DNA_END=653 /DNA_ORIENTATION=+
MNPKPSASIAAFDFDGCLAKTPLGGNDPTAWKLMFPHVPAVLRTLHSKGFKVVVITNESMDRLKKPEAIRGAIRKKCGRLEGFAEAVGAPMQVLCATAKDEFRKPESAAWAWLVEHGNDEVPIDLSSSFFTGDAAGRPGDHGDSDKAFAAKVGVSFHTESDFFVKLHPA